MIILDSFNQEIEKILLEKGLLAIIAIVVTFLFSRILERFKAKNALGNIVYDLRFRAYNEILQILLRHGGYKRQIIRRLIELKVQLETPQAQIDFMNSIEYERNTGTTFEKELKLLDNDFRKVSQDFASSFEDINDSVSKSALFLSQEFMSKLNAYVKSLDQYQEALIRFNNKISKDSAGPIIDSLTAKNTEIQFAGLQKIMLDEFDGRIP